jgi:tyrosine-protein phosphatase SIW14
MRRFAISFLLLSFAVSMALAQAQPSQVAASAAHLSFGEKLHIAGIPNAGKVADQLYRGAQPRNGSIARLKEIGITTIVDLRGEDVGMRDQEKKEANSLGIHFVSIPVSGWAPPKSDQVAQFLSLFDENAKERVFVHCRLGEDRTGVFVAIYRMAVQKWTAEQAINEMYFFGFNGFWHRAMISFVRNFTTFFSPSPTSTRLDNSKSSVSSLSPVN